MNERLKLIFSNINAVYGVMDVGTDHGYIPIELASSGFTGNIIASDINPLPLGIARRNAEKAGVSDSISFVLKDGIDPELLQLVDTVIIAGMGGDTICHILDLAYEHISGDHTFLLQPMSKPEVLRYWLVNNGFSIKSEALVYDNERLYSVLTVRFTGTNSFLSDMELFTGSVKLIENSEYYNDQMKTYLRKFERICEGNNGNDRLYTSLLMDLKQYCSKE